MEEEEEQNRVSKKKGRLKEGEDLKRAGVNDVCLVESLFSCALEGVLWLISEIHDGSLDNQQIVQGFAGQNLQL